MNFHFFHNKNKKESLFLLLPFVKVAAQPGVKKCFSADKCVARLKNVFTGAVLGVSLGSGTATRGHQQPPGKLCGLINTKKGKKRCFIKHIRLCFKLWHIAQETRFRSPTFKTDDPAVYGTCSCSEANLVLTAAGKPPGACRVVSVSSASFQMYIIQHSTVA